MAKTRNNYSLPAEILKGTAVGIISLLLGIMIVAKCIEIEWITEKSMRYAVMILLMISSYLGSITGKTSKGQNRILVCGLTALAYYISLLVMTLIFFHGKYSGIGVTALIIICGSILPLLIPVRRHGVKKKVKPKISNW